MVQIFKNLNQKTRLSPSIHPAIQGVPIAIAFRKLPPLASVFKGIKHCLHNLVIAVFDIASLNREYVFYLVKMFYGEFFCRFHVVILAYFGVGVNTP